MPMPAEFYDWVSYGSQLQVPIDQPSTDLAVLIARFVEISSIIHSHVISDGKPKTVNVLQQLLDLDSDMASWEAGLEGYWLYETVHATHFPPKAVFEGEYHKYHNIWTARIWNYYRWARVLVNQNLLDLANKNPVSSLSLVSAAARDNFLANIRRLARDTLVSAPTHWRHPALDGAARITVESPGGGGAGSAGLPALLFHLKVAGCAPGAPKAYWEWALGVIQTIWGDMGMLHARSMMEAMRAHEDTVLRSGAAGILADDW
ncbi:C6 zinc finger domain-containing protein [Colletotrichum tofieldiae]|nr:C6 zinc finger domain-containing protein [Colletotrichum tofieldiae]GKT73339.1 C6 zinc finger domain-containing protein [Colletotrichum tofieldiae]